MEILIPYMLSDGYRNFEFAAAVFKTCAGWNFSNGNYLFTTDTK